MVSAKNGPSGKAFPDGPAAVKLYWVQGRNPPGQLSPPPRFV